MPYLFMCLVLLVMGCAGSTDAREAPPPRFSDAGIDGAVPPEHPVVRLVALRHDLPPVDSGSVDGGAPDVQGMAGSPSLDDLPGLCEPCESTCSAGFVCVDIGSIGHTDSLGDGNYCLPACDTYLPDLDENPACRVFDDHRCIPSLGACRPHGYPASSTGVREQCAAFLAP